MKSACVLGLGKSGCAAANLALKLGYNVLASDSGKKREIKNLNKKVSVEFGEHSDKILTCDFIIKSPGIDPDIAILKKASQKNIEIISEMDFALKNSQFEKIIAVTGTNGKTTTADLTAKIIKAYYKNSILCGNIGFPLSQKALNIAKDTIVTAELSSYQLEDSPKFKPNISVLLNIASDHLEHHKTMAKYIKAKENIFINQTFKDFAIINYDDKICRKLSLKVKANRIFFSKKSLKRGVFYDNGDIVFKIFNKCCAIKPKIDIAGEHNIENILAAASAAYCAGVCEKTIEKVISKYKGVEHRIEWTANINGINYYNDSKATNVDSTKAALKAFGRNILLIMGGRDKGSPYLPLRKLIKDKVRKIFLIGEARNKIKKDLKNCTKFSDCINLKNAVWFAHKEAVCGDTVLFSPACSSFDQFNNFEERGLFFKKEVLSIKGSLR